MYRSSDQVRMASQNRIVVMPVADYISKPMFKVLSYAIVFTDSHE